ncbi:hypothetical protein ASG99_27265 [Bacillus sp. Soil768D1]|nr:hypothetical protein ASG99_27265 [Bacillus sp. Soil768D1]
MNDLERKENDIDCSLRFDASDKYFISADIERIDVVLDNLVTNANGVGDMVESDLDSIWRPFNVLEKSRSKELSGTGLGLPIIRTILEQHNVDFGFELKNNRLVFFVTFV